MSRDDLRAEEAADRDDDSKKDQKESAATRIFGLALAAGAELFQTPAGEAFATLPIRRPARNLAAPEPGRPPMARAALVATRVREGARVAGDRGRAGATWPVTPPWTPGATPSREAKELRPFTRPEIDELAVELGPTYGPLVVFAAETGLRTNEWVALERRDIDRPAAPRRRRAAPRRRRRADPVPEDRGAPARAAESRAVAALDAAAAAPRHAAPVPCRPRRPHRARQLAHPRVVPGARRGRDRAARPVLPAPHLRDRSARGRRVDLPACPRHGHQREDDRPHLRAPRARLARRRSARCSTPAGRLALMLASDDER